MTALFWLLAAALAGAGTALLIWPLVRAAPPTRPDRRTATLDVHRERLAALEADAEADSNEEVLPGGRVETVGREARSDAARALLRDLEADESTGDDHPGPARPPPRRVAAGVLGIAFPLLGAGLYVLLGEPRALAPPDGRPAAPAADAIAAEIERLIADAETIARANGNRLDGEPTRLIERALALGPNHRKALWLGAVVALHEDRAPEARDRLERLRTLGPLDEQETRLFDRLMARARTRLAEP